jgi:hypothetical protein
MSGTIYWNSSGYAVRLAVVQLTGIGGGTGTTVREHRLARTDWDALPPAVRDVLRRKGIVR